MYLQVLFCSLVSLGFSSVVLFIPSDLLYFLCVLIVRIFDNFRDLLLPFSGLWVTTNLRTMLSEIFARDIMVQPDLVKLVFIAK